MTWLFPFNLLARISALQHENSQLRAMVKDLNHQLAAERIAQCSLTAAYTAAASSMAASYQESYNAAVVAKHYRAPNSAAEVPNG